MSQVKITTNRHSGTFHLRSTNAGGLTVDTDGSPEIGGSDQGFRAMELLLASLASCSAIDVLLILKKQRQTCEDIKIVVTADRVSVDKHSEFRNIHLHFELFGDIKETKAKKAIELSLDSYCSVAQILKKSAEISYDFSIQIDE
ncbi:MAG: OsmC family protein [Saprospiraceae bacterium]|nr:OsmC family protein [Saprospiraceae bacterium]